MAKLLFRSIRSGKKQALITDLESIARKEIEKAMDNKVKPALVKSHELVVRSWKHKPGFQSRKFIRPDSISINVFPTGKNKDIYKFVDQGTKPHTITAKSAPNLKFPWGGKGSYVPKTKAKPARTVSSGGYVKNPKTIYVKKVNHPGTEAREFSKTIAKDIVPDFRRIIENTFRQVARMVEE